jgi:FlaA1/EpsC-like NDP-sugar epimerase
MTHSLDGAHVLIIGGTGSLGQRLFHRILTGEAGTPEVITIFSRDEAKQHYMRLAFMQLAAATDEVIYRESAARVRFFIGDVRNAHDVRRAADNADVIIHAAALKQVPTCEYFASAAVDTNIMGAMNVVRAVREGSRRTRHVIGISTDKACKPVNLMGMTKAIQERVLVQANLEADWCRFINVRHGNVMASRGSAIPYFIELVRRGEPIPITDERMTRFLMTLDQSVDAIFQALRHAHGGETYLPVVPAARVVDIARAVAGDEAYPLVEIGIRPGEKIHEILVSEEEVGHTIFRGENVVIQPILPELRQDAVGTAPLPFSGEYSSGSAPVPADEVAALLQRHGLTAESAPVAGEVYG